jgi:glycosyltransferase involved in cell wall biosynthesis
MLSFVIPAYNEEFELSDTIRAIRTAADAVGTEEYEMIVVDDGSTDRTAEIAVEEGARLVQIQRRHIAASRNAGAHAAKGDVLFFVDADTRISKDHITGATDALKAGCSGGGARVAIEGFVPLWARIFVRLFSIVYFGNNLGAGAFLFTTRDNFEEAGGFDEQLFIGEEVYFSQALKKLGRFRLLKTPVLTSGRKLRMYSGSYILWRSFWIVLRGKRGVQTRRNLELWYEGKRESG